ncbi:hypothetical protein PIB30_099940 [Stylosanthes scabra]|uniref:Uncharacterized protein n=1 Tax=Stylosanthes scabra TaxID=79078 RepID=A0ABU6VVG2_9FABA|nr:hypothetical protein [Stylosanthes scabra]
MRTRREPPEGYFGALCDRLGKASMMAASLLCFGGKEVKRKTNLQLTSHHTHLQETGKRDEAMASLSWLGTDLVFTDHQGAPCLKF